MRNDIDRFPKVYRKHDAIVYHESDKACPLCVAENKIKELVSDYDTLVAEYDALQEKLDVATSGCAGLY